MDPVVHFEMAAVDKDRVKKFYEDAFGWKMTKLGEDMGEYIIAHTTETDENNMVKTPGAINGGFFQRDDTKPGSQHLSVVISVSDINESIEKVKEAGGEVFGEPMEIPGIGTYVAFQDSEGNRVGMLQQSM